MKLIFIFASLAAAYYLMDYTSAEIHAQKASDVTALAQLLAPNNSIDLADKKHHIRKIFRRKANETIIRAKRWGWDDDDCCCGGGCGCCCDDGDCGATVIVIDTNNDDCDDCGCCDDCDDDCCCCCDDCC